MSELHASSRKKSNLGKIGVAIVVAVLLAVSIFFALKYFNLKNNPAQATQQETKSLTTKVGQLISLPSGETPTVATVKDISKLKDQPFFSGAKDGDKLLIYTNAKKAIIYRESDNKIINVGPIAINSADTAQPAKK